MKLLRDYRVATLAVLVLSLVALGGYSFATRDREQTDNAIVRCDITDVVSEERGIIRAVRFADNQAVAVGDTLIVMDQEAFTAARNRAGAALDSAKVMLDAAMQDKTLADIDSRAQMDKSRAAADGARARIASIDYEVQQIEAETAVAQAKLASEEGGLRRTRQLYAQNFLSEKHLEDAGTSQQVALSAMRGMQAKKESARARRTAEQSALREAEANHQQALRSRDAKIAAAEAAVRTRQTQVEVAKAELELAQIKLTRTEIKARRPGDVTNRRVAAGEHVEVGQPIASITSCGERAWVEANFKETQIERMTPGQPVAVRVDAYPGVVFKGAVESMANGSGSMFSVLPPENATGNFTKVVQRFPVKIRLEPVAAEGPRLRAGMSAVVAVGLEKVASAAVSPASAAVAQP
ncbi:MAG: HlyD family secretion protein [Pseudomonadota bacterium]